MKSKYNHPDNKSLNKKWHHLFAIILMIYCNSSCVNTKKVAYFQSSDTTKISTLSKILPRVSKIQSNDLLAVTVSTFNSESNEILNFSNINALTMSNFPGSVGTYQGRQPLGYQVDSTGSIVIPFIGKQHVGGLNLEQAAEKIRIAVEKTLKAPSVNIRFLNHKFSVLGEVNKVGTYNLLDDRTTIIEALSMAGDMTVYGDRTKISIIRDNNGVKQLAKLNLLNHEVFTSPYFYIQNGDVIYIEPTKGKVTFTDQRIQLIPSITGVATTFILLLNLIKK